VVPITPPDDPLSPNPGKAPIGRGWGTRRLSTRALLAIYRRYPRAGVGLARGEREVERTIRSGLEAGLAHPRGSGAGRGG
jgi:hypothetical protein